ncbi:MAG TPA: hypothetical protein PKI14_04435 [Fervidobacterium sp.]|nr:hypothetical protein [Fervidobacterium sp.]
MPICKNNHKYSKDRIRCPKCHNNASKKRYEEKKEEILAKNKEYHNKNREKLLTYKRNYYLKKKAERLQVKLKKTRPKIANKIQLPVGIANLLISK